jgi:DNA modification methylase
MGPGTTNFVVQRMNRNTIGIEIVPEYYEMVKEQLESTKLVLFEPKEKYEQIKPERREAIR